jgi:CheY-like chemotaxis protein
MADPIRVLVVDDDQDILRQLGEHFKTLNIGGATFQCVTTDDFNGAIPEIKARKFDLVILDVFKGEAGKNDQSGRDVLDQLKAVQFLPVIFFTALPHQVEDLSNPVVKIAAKSDGVKNVNQGIAEFQATGLLQLNRIFIEHVDKTLRDYLWEFLPKHWTELFGKGDPTTLGYVLCRRLAASLNSRRAEELGREMGSSGEVSKTESIAHPMQFYIIPATEKAFLAGDIVERLEDRTNWIVITPSCDFVQKKVDYTLLCRCMPVTAYKEYTDWNPVSGHEAIAEQQAKEKDAQKAQPRKDPKSGDPDQKIRELISNRRGQQDRYYFLPGVLDFPDSIIDHQQSYTVEFTALENMQKFRKIASLDSPFREGITQKFSRFFGRVGFPDLDVPLMISRLANSKRLTKESLCTDSPASATDQALTRTSPPMQPDVAVKPGPVEPHPNAAQSPPLPEQADKSQPGTVAIPEAPREPKRETGPPPEVESK